MNFLQSIEAWLDLRKIDEETWETDYDTPDVAYARLVEKVGSLGTPVALFTDCDGKVAADGSSLSCTCAGPRLPCTALLEPAYNLREPIELIIQVKALAASHFSQVSFGMARSCPSTSLEGYFLGEDEDSFGYRKGFKEQPCWNTCFGTNKGPPGLGGEVVDFEEGDIIGFRYDPGTAKARAFLNSRILSEFTLGDSDNFKYGQTEPVYLGVTFFVSASLTVLIQTGVEVAGGYSETRSRCHGSPQLQLEAHDADIQIWRAINAQGEDSARDDVSIEDVFAGMRETLQGAQECAKASEVKDEEFEDVRLPVDALRYTQFGCSRTFCCGRTLQQTASEIVKGKVDPLQAWWCKLRVVKRNGLLLSLDNRRLWSMKEAQRQMRELDPEKVLYTKAKLYRWLPVFDVFLRHLDHACSAADGGDVYVRGPKRRRSG